MKKWELYKCISDWNNYEWLFKVITKTDLTYKLERIEKPLWFTYINNEIITWKFNNECPHNICYIEDDNFIIYINRSWIPFSFTLLKL